MYLCEGVSAVIKHTFLFDQQLWIATGIYFDDADKPIPAAGESRIIHQTGRWIIESMLRVFGDAPLEIKNRYEVMPFSDDTTYVTRWESNNTALGRLIGKFVIIDDTIFSIYQSEDNMYSGTELVMKIADDYYESKGCLFKGNDKLSSWAFALRHT
jgi:hypothetical protein